nr:hypothetical protein [Tanacetum cinerariifolium]
MKNIQWTQEEEAALQEMKKFVEILPTLTALVQGEIVMIYLAALTESISKALFVKREEENVHIYFVSRVLQGAELNYLGLEKLILALVHAARWLRRKGDKTPKDFLIKVAHEDNKKKVEEKADTKFMKTKLSCEWKHFTDGAASSDGSSAGLILIDHALRFRFKTTNNEAEYEALLIGLRISQEMEITSLAIFVDSQLLVNQIKEEKEILQVETKEGESSKTPIHEYLVSGLLLEDPKESRKIRVKAPQYKLIRGNLYRRSFYTLWLQCIASQQTDDIVKEVHEGSCGFKAEPRSMVVRIIKQCYYWPSMHRDAAKVLQDCEKCKEQSAIWKVAEISAITTINLCKGLKVTQSFFLITEHMEIMNHIEKQLAQSQQGGVDDLAQVLWVHRTLPRNSQKETPFSITYSSEAIILIPENDVTKDDRGRIKEVDKRRGNKEIASIKEAYYQRKLHKHHSKRSSHSIYKIRDFILLSQSNTAGTHVWQGPHMISKVYGGGLYKIVDAFDHSLTQIAKSMNFHKFYM